jgi:GNAT superfamily N-acetyltransferase
MRGSGPSIVGNIRYEAGMATVTIEQLNTSTTQDAEQIAALLPQLTEHHEGITPDRLAQVITTPGAVYVARSEGRIVGMIQRVDVSHVVRMKSWIEDFVVDENSRGQGIATMLLEAAIAGAPVETASINLTSKSTRANSHRLYAKLGFELREDATLWRLARPSSGR